MEAEIGGNALLLFVYSVDNHYDSQLVCKISDFADTRAYLVPNEAITQFYSMLRSDFPSCHHIFASIVSTKEYHLSTLDELPETEQDQLHRKEQMILYLFLGLLRTRNRLLLRHCTMVQPLACWFQGQESAGHCTVAGGFDSALATV